MNKLQKLDFSWHADQPDVPQKSATEMKAFFDAPSQTLMNKTNELIGDLYGDEEKAGEIPKIHQNIDALEAEDQAIHESITALEVQDQAIQESITALQDTDVALSGDITQAKNDITALQNDISELQGTDMALSGDITGVKDELEIKISTEVATLNNTLNNTLNTQKNILDTLSDEVFFIGERKQDKLEAGENITIENNVISAGSCVKTLDETSVDVRYLDGLYRVGDMVSLWVPDNESGETYEADVLHNTDFVLAVQGRVYIYRNDKIICYMPQDIGYQRKEIRTSDDSIAVHEITEDVTTAEISEGMSKVTAEDGITVSYMNGGEYTEALPVSNGSIILKAYNADGYVTNIIIYDINGNMYSITQPYMNDTATLNTFKPGQEDEDTEINSWSAVQKIVRLGLASQIFEVGDQFVSTKNGQKLVWDVIGFDHDFPIDNDEVQHSMTLQLHDSFGSMQFDAPEAFYYASEGLPAGTYHFTVGEHDWKESEVGKTYQFTLTKSIPVGGQLVFSATYNTNINGTYVGSCTNGTSKNYIERVQLTEGTDGTDLGTMDNTVNGNLNSCQRALAGYSNYEQSAIRQYLNSDTSAGNVWTPQNVFDRIPNWASNTAGFIYGMDDDFLSVIGAVGKTTALDKDSSTTTSEKFFLLSCSEVYGGNENDINEGEPYPYYSENSNLSEPGLGSDYNRIKYSSSTATYWFLRSPRSDYAGNVRSVNLGGNISYFTASDSRGVAPACCIY